MTTTHGDRRIRLLGKLLHPARDARDWWRLELIAPLPVGIDHTTLGTYEQGTRHRTVARLFELCDTLGVRASEILAAIENDADNATENDSEAQVGPARFDGVTVDGATVDLVAMSVSHPSSLRPLRLWAEHRHVRLTPAAITVLAGLRGMSPPVTRGRLHRRLTIDARTV
ncbi:hypothetical protein [Alloactinosynnema sp. L-07]|uniref:hypothetical protein n=1 Tax=Alloactinosynnema sp. L-07 TaxID=1653480 RepID=UPI00065F0946|nr:hypothetical protein [Alloactinosynnema sp. L-07]CRK57667.1 hypothetical protein [Alloactinosynnema sp. L-07]